jgi:2'-5' RNA ligase
LGQNIRTFIAVRIPDSIRDRIAKLQTELRKHGADIKWVRPESIHVTLKFLGDVEETRMEEVGEAVEKAVEHIPPFVVSVNGLGTFPNDRRPRVLWVGVDQGDGELVDMAKRIEDSLSVLGFEKEERRYSAHLTMGRVRSPRRIGETVRAMHVSDFSGGAFRVEEVFVMKSDLKPTGAVYTALKTIKLRG